MNNCFVFALLFVGHFAFAEASEITFYAGPDCEAETIIATVPKPQTAASCHDYAVNNGLENLFVESYGWVTEQGNSCALVTTPASESFEAACDEAFAGSTRP